MAFLLLKIIAIMHILSGIALAAAWFITPLHAPFVRLLYPDGTSNTQQVIFWISILGPTLASWGVLFLNSVIAFEKTPTQGSFLLMLAALLAWVLLDVTLCLSNGFNVLAAIDVMVFLLVVFLLLRTRNPLHH